MDIKKYDVVQIIPDHDWGGCFLTVTEIKRWGVQGFVQVPMSGQAFIRIKYGEFEMIGESSFIPIFEENEE